MMQNTRRDVIDQQRPNRAGPFFVVKGILAGCNFAPSGNPVGNGLNQNDVALVSTAEAGLEKVNERHANVPQNNPVYFDSHFPNR